MPKQVWLADDGTQFDNEKDCLLYECFLRHLSNRSVPEELRGLMSGDNNQSIAKNFYEVLNTVKKCMIFLESVELEAAPNERLLREEKERINNEKKSKLLSIQE